jgi:hypothetical protein
MKILRKQTTRKTMNIGQNDIKLHLKKQNGRVWTRLIWLRLVALVNTVMNYRDL